MVVSFDENDCEWVICFHEDALVVTMMVANFTSRRILIYNNSSINILFWDLFAKMGLTKLIVPINNIAEWIFKGGIIAHGFHNPTYDG